LPGDQKHHFVIYALSVIILNYFPIASGGV
jgi:hypothetical protein